MPTQFIIANPDERSGWVPITMTMHDAVVLVRIPHPPAPVASDPPPRQPAKGTTGLGAAPELTDDETITWEDAEWR